MSKSTRFCFTLNNYDNGRIDALKEFFATHCKYLVYGKEVAPTTNTPHLQGYFTTKKQQRITALLKLGFTGAHIEVAKGPSPQCAAYCKKGSQSHEEWSECGVDGGTYGRDADVTEYGEVPTQGKRSDLLELCVAIEEGQTMEVVASIDPATYVRNYRGLAAYAALKTKNFTPEGLRGYWYWGPPGTGKTLKARGEYPDAFIKEQSKWWCGYTNEKVVILDDLDSNCLGHYLKIWSDRYACSGQFKGGTVKLQHEKFIVTSNYSIEELWKGDDNMIAAIKRRFQVVNMVEPYIFKAKPKTSPVFAPLSLRDRPNAGVVGDNKMTFTEAVVYGSVFDANKRSKLN